jgi:hypothetical protein
MTYREGDVVYIKGTIEESLADDPSDPLAASYFVVSIPNTNGPFPLRDIENSITQHKQTIRAGDRVNKYAEKYVDCISSGIVCFITADGSHALVEARPGDYRSVRVSELDRINH